MQDINKNSNLTKYKSIDEVLQNCPKNEIIGNNLIRAWKIINDQKYKKIVCSISGGSDSDVMLDIVWKCDKDNKVDYVWFDTGLEYQATKDHLKYLEKKYDINIIPYKAIKPIPLSCKEYGQPFLSKKTSQMIYRLQKHNFDFVNDGGKSYNELMLKYPRMKAALDWWCSNNKIECFNIHNNAWLKEFLISYPPDFYISDKCCKYAKKDVAHKLIKENEYDLNIFGVRKAEGGVRQKAYTSCFDESESKCDNYRPLFWYSDKDKNEYEVHYEILHSKCYTEYGFIRTGCCCCPFGREREFELQQIKVHEPKLYKAVVNVFGKSYEYTRKYLDFCKEMNKIHKSYRAYLRKQEIVKVFQD